MIAISLLSLSSGLLSAALFFKILSYERQKRREAMMALGDHEPFVDNDERVAGVPFPSELPGSILFAAAGALPAGALEDVRQTTSATSSTGGEPAPTYVDAIPAVVTFTVFADSSGTSGGLD